MESKRELNGKQLVLGIGCGRTGSESLAYLLDSQDNAVVSHEFSLFCAEGHRAKRHRLPMSWALDAVKVRQILDGVLDYPGTVVGDVASYWLPQLSWILEEYSALRVVAITRPRDQVVQSFMSKTTTRNHWIEHEGNGWEVDPVWDSVFPKYEVKEKAEAIGLYWDEYYAECERLESAFPGRFKTWPLGALSNAGSVGEILDHVGIERRLHRTHNLAPRNRRNSVAAKVRRRLVRFARRR